MGITKQYLRYANANVFGIVTGHRSNIKMITFRNSVGKYLACGACAFVFIWDLKKGEIVLKLISEKASEVTYIEQHSQSSNILAVGYHDGSLRLFKLNQKPSFSKDPTIQLKLEQESINSYLTLNGHKSAITCIRFDANCVRMVSGSKDTDLVVWDLVGECGLFRLKGHKAPITAVSFMQNRNILLSSAKDMLIKFWDLDTRHCFKTLVLHKSEINDLILLKDDTRMITGGQDNELRAYELIYNDVESTGNNYTAIVNDHDEKENVISIIDCRLIGSIIRESKDALTQLSVDNTLSIFSSHSANEKHVEIFKANTCEEIKKRLSKKLKKSKRKIEKLENEETVDFDNKISTLNIEQTASDEFTKISTVKSKHKVKYVDIFSTLMKQAKANSSIEKDENEISLLESKIACCTANNQIELYILEINKQINNTKDPILMYTIEVLGHRTDVRTISFNSDSTAFLTASGDSMKIWNRLSLNCIRTFDCDYALCCLFLADDNHALVGTKSGKIQLFNINLANMLENVKAHDEETSIWSMCLVPDNRGFVSGGADKTIRFWDFDLVDDEISKTKKQLTFVHTRTLKLDDDVLFVKISPNGRLVAASLLDNTVKIFFMDSLKLFLNLYGHKQPVLSVDISFDNRLIVTGSADRHLKIWGLDFGDCHRSLFAHEDSIMKVQFVGKTHYLFSVGKDGKLIEWDTDNFQKIITLEGHMSEIWAMAISNDGKYVLTASHDKSIRLWEKTNEPLVLEDERETEKEKQYENELTKEEQLIPGESNKETGLATIKTFETIKSAEKLIEALMIHLEEQSKYNNFIESKKNVATEEEKKKIKIEEKHPLLIAFGNIGSEDYVLEVLKKTKSSELETTLIILEFEYVKVLMEIVCGSLMRNQEIEISLRCLIFLFKINFGTITSTKSLVPIIKKTKQLCRQQIISVKEITGFNLAALKHYKTKLEENHSIRLFSDLTLIDRARNSKSKKMRGLLSLNSASKN